MLVLVGPQQWPPKNVQVMIKVNEDGEHVNVDDHLMDKVC